MMHNARGSQMENTCARLRPRDERLRIPGQERQPQIRTRCHPNINIVSRKPLPYSKLPEEDGEPPRTPRVRNYSRCKDGAMRRELAVAKASHESPSQESDTSMGILDYYMCEPSPSPLAMVTQDPQETEAVDGATIAAFDFELEAPKQVSEPISMAVQTPRPFDKPRKASLSKPLPSPPSQARCQYSLFPKDPPTPPISIYSDSSIVTGSPHPMDPTRPRKASLASSVRSRADSCNSVRLLPSATFTSPSPSTHPRRPLRIRTLTQSSGTSQQTSVSGAPPSRWSGDTIEVPLTPPPCTAGAESSVTSSPPWPTGSFFEDDDDEEVPLRRKVAEKFRGSRAKGTRAQQDAKSRAGSGGLQSWAGKWLACGCGRGRK